MASGRIVIVVGALCCLVAARAQAQVSPGPLARPHEKLEGALKCFECHGKAKEAMDSKCLQCHQDIAWLQQRGRGLHGIKKPGPCASCHPDHGGRDFDLIQWPGGDAKKFDHQAAGWPLAGKHASVECRQCHQAKHQVSQAAALSPGADPARRWIGLETACASCHEDVHRGALGTDCARCHGDALTAWKPAAAFDHARTQFPLLGGHAPVACAKCHQARQLKLTLDPAGRPLPLYKPLPHAECSACHTDPHAGRLGPTCSTCHVPDDWKRVERARFNHDLTRYPLRGRHATVACAKCHDPAKGREGPVPFAACGSCHRDPHAGTATLAGKTVDCASCHDVNGWRPSTFTVARHAQSAYPLAGGHRAVDCAKCHTKSPPGRSSAALGEAAVLLRPAHARCMDCHDDAHKGQVASRAHKGACEACHVMDGWRPSTFTVAQHAALRLPLEGRHATTPCRSCHGPDRTELPPLPGPEKLGSARVALTPAEVACSDCHLDPHQGRFVTKGARPQQTTCVSCHGTGAFRPSTVDVTMHRLFSYPLEGAHRSVSCDGCHAESRTPRARSTLVLARIRPDRMTFFVSDRRCASCHKDPHGSQFAARKDAGACGACHGQDAFRPASRFDHEKDSEFSLKGAHARVACVRCHAASRKDPSGRSYIVYRPVPKDCKSCHGSERKTSSIEHGFPAPGRDVEPPAALAFAPAISEGSR